MSPALIAVVQPVNVEDVAFTALDNAGFADAVIESAFVGGKLAYESFQTSSVMDPDLSARIVHSVMVAANGTWYQAFAPVVMTEPPPSI